MKVGILTFHFAKNYGAVFQAFALKTALAKMGHKVIVVNYCPTQMQIGWDYSFFQNSKKTKPTNVKHLNTKAILIGLYNNIKFNLFEKKYVRAKFEGFERFVSDFLCSNQERITNCQQLQEFLKDYDAIVCGSDQIWNPNITNGFDEVYFTTGLNINRKLSYAASIGDISILNNVERQNRFIEMVKNYQYISVRESNLENLIRSYELECECHCDPTFLLSPSDYNDISSKKALAHKKPYILVYHLFHDKSMLSYAKKLAKTKEMELFVVNGTLSCVVGSVNDMDPRAFLSLLRDAAIIITNSFHGIALSLIHHKEFEVFMPVVHKDRIYNLLSMYSLQDRIITDSFQIAELPPIDYSVIDKKTSDNRNRALAYLNRALS